MGLQSAAVRDSADQNLSADHDVVRSTPPAVVGRMPLESHSQAPSYYRFRHVTTYTYMDVEVGCDSHLQDEAIKYHAETLRQTVLP